MLPASTRVRSRSEHRLVAARGRRARRGPIVVHLISPSTADESLTTGAVGPPRAGVVVGKRVGPAVRRNLVKRRLRELLRLRLPALPQGTRVVVRALPGSDQVGFEHLGYALDAALRALGAVPGARHAAHLPARGGDTVGTRGRTAAHDAVTVARDPHTVGSGVEEGRGPA